MLPMVRCLLPYCAAIAMLMLPACPLEATPDKGATASAAGLRFTRDPDRFRAKEEQFAAALGQQSPQAAAAVRQLFARDVLGAMRPELRRLGLDDQDVIDMTALYWIAAWEASNDIVGRRTSPADARSARDRLAAGLLSDPAIRSLSETDRQDIADTMLLQAIMAAGRMEAAARAGADVRARMSDTIHAEAKQLLHVDLRRTGIGGTPAGDGGPQPTMDPARVPPAATMPPAGRGNWAAVEGVYFRIATRIGVGGRATIDYRPIILFRDGRYYNVEGPAIEDVDLAAVRAAQPARFGRWSRSAGGYTLIDSSGRAATVRLQGGTFFRAFPAEAVAGRLAGTFRRLSGGGNAAYGGGAMAFAENILTFTPGGQFSRAANAGGTSDGGWTGVGVTTASRGAANAGTYRIERYTITFTEPDGSIRRQFFAIGSKNDPPQPEAKMIFVGNRVFSLRR
jgi:hypothetical protein